MLEGIWLYIMQGWQENKDKARTAWSNKAVCPRIFKIVGKNSEKATYCVPHKSNDENVEVWGDYGDRFAVNVKDRTCTCRRWDLTGIPCVHGISAIWALNEDPMDYVHELYSVDNYQKCYANCILPLSGQSEWEQADVPVPIPPLYGRAAGRPKKNRRRSEMEMVETKEKRRRLTRSGHKGKCRLCGEEGHNIRTCKNKNAPENDTELELDDIDQEISEDNNGDTGGLDDIEEAIVIDQTMKRHSSKLPVSIFWEYLFLSIQFLLSELNR